MTPKQEKWNERIRAAGPSGASKFSGKTMEQMMCEGGCIWRYEGPSYNTNAFREGYDKINWKK